MAIKVSCRVDLYSVSTDSAKGSILVHSHWNDDNKVEIEIEDKRFCVSGYDLIEAIRNAINTNRYGR